MVECEPERAFAFAVGSASRPLNTWRYELDDIMLLKVGRHIRPAANFKLIVAREEGESNFLYGYRKLYPNLMTTSHGGPFTLLDGELHPGDVELAARIVARYSQGRDAREVALEYRNPDGTLQAYHVRPMPADDVPKAWLL